ncbi:MAG: hypothetical protein K8F62_17875 [Pseudorhodoplanes sp.]|nr:hypothetical protein [Pseudorhodoplanes sp.]
MTKNTNEPKHPLIFTLTRKHVEQILIDHMGWEYIDVTVFCWEARRMMRES